MFQTNIVEEIYLEIFQSFSLFPFLESKCFKCGIYLFIYFKQVPLAFFIFFGVAVAFYWLVCVPLQNKSDKMTMII